MNIEKIEIEDLTGDMELMVYTDGACKGNPGPGGWAFAIFATVYDTKERYLLHEQAGGVKHTTSIQMELQAAIQAMKFLKTNNLSNVTVVTDSEYLHNGITQWIDKWRMKGWKTSKREPVKNKELWLELESLNNKVKRLGSVTWAWSRGHSSNQWNDHVDQLASSAAFEAKGGSL